MMKKCAECGEILPIDKFSYRNRKLGNGKIRKEPLCYCRECNSKRSSNRYYNIKTKGIRFVYRILNKNDEVIYVGKTESLPTRTNQHFSKSNSHLNKKARKEMAKLQYIAMASTSLMDIKEIYYINLYKPKYNMSYVYDEEPFTISDFSKDVWIDYDISNIYDIKREDLALNVCSIFKRNRSKNYLVYIEYKDIDGKKHQQKYNSFENELEADECVEKLKKIYNRL